MSSVALRDSRDILRHRLQNQRLIGNGFRSAAEAVARHLAVQSQDYGGAKWGVGQRCERSSDASVEKAFQQGKLLRTHVLRPTWHFVVPADARWLLELTAPRIRAFSTPYFRKHGLDVAALTKSRRVLEELLADGEELTRDELAAALTDAGLPTRGEALSYQLIAAELDAVLISGGRRGKQHTYTAFDRRVPPSSPLSREEGLARLAQRYLAGHGPALVQDLAWWAGLTIADAKRGIAAADGVESADVDGKKYWLLPLGRQVPFESPVVRLLPNYDEQLIAYRYRGNAVPESLTSKVSAGSGIFDGHLLMIDGVLAGGWRRELFDRHVELEVSLVRSVNAAEKAQVAAAAERYAHFVDLELRLKLRTHGKLS